jgi:benzoate-CoA ligase
MFLAVPTVFDGLLRLPPDDFDTGSLTRCVASGEAMPTALHTAWRQRTGIGIMELFGATETLTSFMATNPDRDEPGTLGSPVPGFSVKLTDETGHEIRDNSPGRLMVRGPGVAETYFHGAPILSDGWLDSGDVCQRTAGRMVHLGRADDLFRTAGQWVSPAMVENGLLEHPMVAQCAVVPCTVRGQQYPCAFVVPSPGAAPAQGDLIRFAKSRLQRHLCPIKVVLTDALPRTATGKMQRHKLARQVADGPNQGE